MEKFDFVVGNPAFNISEKNNIAGTGGNTTLYRTATRQAATLLTPGGSLLYVTLKGIMRDLFDKGPLTKLELVNLNLMDDINIWPYNTCYFQVQNLPRSSVPTLCGGMCSTIYTPFREEGFQFTYYSGNNNGYNKFFGEGKKNKVIRRLPGRNSDKCTYDFTDKDIAHGPKFCFSVLESKKSYTVTDDPVFGGTICYVSTDTIEQAKKLKLFTEVNPIFAEYIKRMHLRGHAFGLRNVRRFDLDQIKTGTESPNEWNINSIPKFEYEEEHIAGSVDRKKNHGEVFTPASLVNRMLDLFPESVWHDSDKKWIDPMCGNGNFLIEVKNRFLAAGLSEKHIIEHIIYGVDILEDNIESCIDRLGAASYKHNLVCADSLKYDYKFDQ